MQKQEQCMTEQQFLRILVKSVCGILLCLAGLVYMTWAWYTMELPTTNGAARTEHSQSAAALPEG